MRLSRLLSMLGLLLAAVAVTAETLVISAPQTAGMSGFRAHWDTPLVLSETGAQKVIDAKITDRGGQVVWANGGGALAFDALNRALLVRFPDAAAQIAAAITAGKTVTKIELVLPYRDEELWAVGNADYIGPEGYTIRQNWDVDKLYRALRPRWHAMAWALRKPWAADAAHGPTYNAAINGAVYWTKYGAADEGADRFPTRFGPAEVSYKAEGSLDLTPLLTDTAYGATLAARLRQFADCGVLVQKEETYDAMYYGGAYEWATATGGRAILVKTPKLVVTLAPGKAELGGNLPAAADVAALKAAGPAGAPTAVMPSADQLAKWTAQYAKKPEWMPGWQWKRVQELTAAEDPNKTKEPFWYQFVAGYLVDRLTKYHWENGMKIIDKPADPAAVYALWVDGLIGRQPRGWSGFESAREMAQWYLYHQALPAPAQDAIKRYWLAWMMPDRETNLSIKEQRDHTYVGQKLIHPMADDPRVDASAQWLDLLNGRLDSYWMKTGDWRGNKSFFRSGFCYNMSTQNFNTTACAGALLAGAIVKAERAMADGRHGAETFPLRMYCWSDGSGQEHIDHYYFAVTMAGNKALADFSQTPYDRLLGQSLLVKNVEELVSAYHPGLRSFIAGSSRTSLDLVLGEQDGLQSVMHTLSKSGAVKDAGTKTLPGNIATWGHDFPPHQVAQQTLVGPWAPEWVTTMVDDKPLPFEAKHTGWGGVKRTCYLARHFGLASNAVNPGRMQVLGVWRREAKQAASMRDLGFLDLRCGTDTTLWVNDGQGSVTQPGTHSLLQAKNKLIALTSPKNNIGTPTSFQSSIGLFNFQTPAPAWEVYVDGKKVALPCLLKQGQRITIKDGVTYVGIIPLPATDLGRDAEVSIQVGPPQRAAFYQSAFGAALEINSYNYKRLEPLPAAQAVAAGKAYGGFIVEFADTEDFPDFAAFQQHLAATKYELNYDAAKSVVSVKYTSGADILEAASDTTVDNPNLTTWLVNGQSPLLPQGIERDTPYAQQGLGKVEKNGATLQAAEGRRIFLLTEPKANVVCAWNPLPDLTPLTLTLPGGAAVAADGTVSLTRITAFLGSGAHRYEIDSAFKPGQDAEAGTATAFHIAGEPAAPAVILNGAPVKNLETKTVDGKTVYVVKIR